MAIKVLKQQIMSSQLGIKGILNMGRGMMDAHCVVLL
jgi:hypothetical protein